MPDKFDLIIVGGGLAGNCLALALQHSGLRCALIEAQTLAEQYASPAGDRALALAYGTVQILDSIGAWQGIKHAATAIEHIHISDRGHFAKARLSAAKQHVEALGYVITARDLESHVAGLVADTAIMQIRPARVMGLLSGMDTISVSLKQNADVINLSASLLIGADGGTSSIRKLLNIDQQTTDYQQTALVTSVHSSLPHKNTAFERFTPSGPLALLPLSKNHLAVVWTRESNDAGELLAGSEADFLAQLQDCFGYRLGRLRLSAPRRAFPLSLIRADKMYAGRGVIIGNAVHQLHPVAGQGFNLGLRDVAAIAKTILTQQQAGKDLGAATCLANYAAARQKDHDLVIGFTDNTVRLFSNDWLPLAAARNFGLGLLDHIPTAKFLLSRYAMGLHASSISR